MKLRKHPLPCLRARIRHYRFSGSRKWRFDEAIASPYIMHFSLLLSTIEIKDLLLLAAPGWSRRRVDFHPLGARVYRHHYPPSGVQERIPFRHYQDQISRGNRSLYRITSKLNRTTSASTTIETRLSSGIIRHLCLLYPIYIEEPDRGVPELLECKRFGSSLGWRIGKVS